VDWRPAHVQPHLVSRRIRRDERNTDDWRVTRVGVLRVRRVFDWQGSAFVNAAPARVGAGRISESRVSTGWCRFWNESGIIPSSSVPSELTNTPPSFAR
jgi:hypothetical protein